MQSLTQRRLGPRDNGCSFSTPLTPSTNRPMFACQVFWLPKAGNSPGEYEDAFWPRQAGIESRGPIRLAVGDGATETSFSGLWARLLVSSYGRGRLTGDAVAAELRRIRRVWRKAVGQKPLPWYAEEKLRSGAFSSLTGLTLFPPEDRAARGGRWHAAAIGDSCLVQARGNDLVCSLPFSHSDEFDSRPRLVSSLESDNADDLTANGNSGAWQAGDSFYLMTDALACWCLRGLEAGERVFERLNEPQTQPDFETLVAELRSQLDSEGRPLLKNDDLTLLRCVAGNPQQVVP
jgi:hypothetical protein